MKTLLLAAAAAALALGLIPSGVQAPELRPQPILTIREAPKGQPRTLRLLQDGQVLSLDEEEYLTRVVLSELPAQFDEETMKAQAVAARTFYLRQAARGRHADADVCAQSSCCQACLTRGELEERLGQAFEEAWTRAGEAVAATKDEVLRYRDELIDATYFSCSGGRTEAAVAVWGGEVPYLQAVDSPGEEQAARYESRVVFSPQALAERLRAHGVEADFNTPPETWLGTLSRTDGGGVDTLRFCGTELGGVQLRSMLGLNSTRFSVSYEDGSFVFDVLGFGHRVGMSQYGAQAMAEAGFDYRAILLYYYPGVQIEKLPCAESAGQ